MPEGVLQRRQTNNSDDVDADNPEKNTDKEESIEKLSFFGPLIKAAASMNPQQFEIPAELVEPITFPGEPIFILFDNFFINDSFLYRLKQELY